MRSSLNEFPHKREGTRHGAVSDHERHRSPLLLAKDQKSRSELSRSVTIETYKIDDPLAKEGEKQQGRVVGRLSEPFGLLDQRPYLGHGSLGFGRAISFDMH